MSASANRSAEMAYRAEFEHVPGRVSDVFASKWYRLLLRTFVVISGQQLPHWFFSDPRDIALGLSTDGFGPFKSRSHTAWPLILFNYNLPPDIRFHKDNIISLGIIPGPKKPWDLDSFLWPFVQEMIQLAIGVLAFDAITKTLFILHAYLIIVFGDIPAVAMLMRMKGQNGISPCRMCTIQGIRIPGSSTTTHYVPLHREKFHGQPGPRCYDPYDLPMRNHATFLEQAQEVQFAETTATEKRLATKYGIKGVPLLSTLTSINFPHSFPYDFMHLIWENLIPNLISFWTGEFKDLDHDGKGYVLEPSVWQAICAASAAAGDTLPSAFGARVPNFSRGGVQISAEIRSVWTLFLAPTLLRRRFQEHKYYKHFMRLVRLLNLCLKYEVTDTEIDEIEEGFCSWVEDYEK
jgi:hypothetical protein